MLQTYFKLSLRNFRKHRTSTLIHLLGLTLGTSACLAIFLIVNYERNVDTFHPDSERIYRIVGGMKFDPQSEELNLGFVPYPVPRAVREEVSGLETVAAFVNFDNFNTGVVVPNGDREAKVFGRQPRGREHAAEIVLAGPEYFQMFQYEWLAGNAQTALAEPYKVVLSARKARLYFGDLTPAEILGRELVYSDSLRMSVAGVVKDFAQTSDFTFTDFLSLSTVPSSFLKQDYNLDDWANVSSASQAFVKLAPGTTAAQVEAQLPAFAKAHFTGKMQFKPALQPLADVHFNAKYLDNFSRRAHLPTLYGLAGVALFILLLAASNFVNLSTAQSFQRAREVGVRKVLGSSRSGLITQFLGETLLLTTVAIGVSLVVVAQLFASFESFLPRGLTFQLNGTVAGFLVLLGLGTALLAGCYPAFALSALAPSRTLKGQVTSVGGQRGNLRKGLIVFQFTISLVFILCTLLVHRQISFMRNKDLGFQSDAVLSLQAPVRAESQLPLLYTKVQQLSGVSKATLQMFEPIGPNFGIDHLTYQGQTFDASPKMGDENFIPFYEMKLLAGRNVRKNEATPELVLSASLVKKMGFQRPEDAIGQALTWNEKTCQVVGVIADFHQQSLRSKMSPSFIATTEDNYSIALQFSSRNPADVEATLQKIAALWASVYPNHKMEYSFLDDTIARTFERERQTSRLVNLATVVALLISCLGLFGLATFAAQQRIKEIGIRKVLGASVPGLTRMLTTEFLRLVVLALVLASPAAYLLMQRWLARFAYHVDIQWWMFVAAGALALVVAFLTVGYQSTKAALTDPVKALRSE